ncbi:MAG: hypothetical protein HKN93_07930 [Acidimicrobiia bacterium]|nr:hypothetical protein [Acidimicrobiia bacterium]
MQTAALAATGIEGTYDAIQVDAAGMGTMVARLHHGKLDGANITMPHKRLARLLADEVRSLAQRTGAVNTYSVDDGKVIGDNTDVAGFIDASDWAGIPDDAPLLILGAGGAAAAALVAFEDRRVHLSARRPAAARALARRVGVDTTEVTWGEAVPNTVVVNCTPLGMRGENLPGGVLEQAAGYIESVYGSGPTPAQQAAEDAGVPCATGLDLLVAQGARSFTIWTGFEAPVGAMKASVTA